MSSVEDKACADRNRSIPDGWIETTLGEICDVKGGKRLPKGETLISKKNKHPYIRITDFSGNSVDKSKLQFVPNDTFEKISRYIVNENDIIISIVGTIGLVAKIDKDLDNANLTENCNKLVNLKGVNNDFMYYYLTSRLGQFEINKNTVGAVQKKLPIYGVQSIKINLPTAIEEQKAIAKALTAFDAKIENLRAQNKTLEQTAQTIFKEWFGKYQIGDVLPDGWRVGEINDLIEFVIDNRGKTPPLVDESIDSYPLIEVNSITGDDRNVNLSVGKKFVDEETYQNWFRKGHPINGDILLSTVGSIGQLAQVFDEKITVAQNIVALRSNTSGNFLYELLKRNQKLIINLDISSVQPSIKVPHLLSMPVVIPELKLIQQFDKVADKLTIKITSNNKQIQTLTKTRDSLLPKLMRGEIRVNGFKT